MGGRGLRGYELMAVTADKLYATTLKGSGRAVYSLPRSRRGRMSRRRINCSARESLLGRETPYPGIASSLNAPAEHGRSRGYRKRKTHPPPDRGKRDSPFAAVIPAARPKPDLMTADKLILYAESAGIEPIVV